MAEQSSLFPEGLARSQLDLLAVTQVFSFLRYNDLGLLNNGWNGTETAQNSVGAEYGIGIAFGEE